MFTHFLPRVFRRCAIFTAAAGVIFCAHPPAHAQAFAASRLSTNGMTRPFYTTRSPRIAAVTAFYSPSALRAGGAVQAATEEENAPAPQVVGGSAGPTVSGSRAVVRRGVAYAPSRAPENVKRAIWAVNAIRSRPYKWGGGHGSFSDSGYDCSGTVSFALHHAGLLGTPMPSSDFLRYGQRGRGKWITVYARHGHTFATIAGLRLDTTDFRFGRDVGPRWHSDGRDTWGFAARHPAGL